MIRKREEILEDIIKKAARLLRGETLTKEQLNLYRLHAKKKNRYKRLRTDVWEINEQWQIDISYYMTVIKGFNFQYKYWLVMIDIYSRYAWVKLVTNIKAKTVVKKFEEICRAEKVIPKRFQSDEGKEFEDIRNKLKKIRIQDISRI